LPEDHDPELDSEPEPRLDDSELVEPRLEDSELVPERLDSEPERPEDDSEPEPD